jgi:hypothetical protein
MSEARQSRRGFLAAFAGLVVAGRAAPAILAKMRAPSWETADPDAVVGPVLMRHNTVYAPAQCVTLTTSHGTYRAPIVDGVADFAHVLPKGRHYVVTAMDANGSPVVPCQIRI